MNAVEMHYDFKQKLNKVDSQQYRNLRPMEIDWFLNEAQIDYVKMIANPKQYHALEVSQRSIDDISTLLTHASVDVSGTQESNRYECDLNELSPEFLYFIGAECVMSRECCSDGVVARVFPMRHSDLFQNNEFNRSSWEWREVAAVFEDDRKLVLFDDGSPLESGTFTIDKVLVDYIRRPRQIFIGGYNTADGGLTTASDPQDCELPYQVHYDVVDIAVMLASSALNNPDVQLKMNKVQINNQ